MKVTLYKRENGKSTGYTVSNDFTFDERLDEEFDGGNCTIIRDTEDELANFSCVFAYIEDGKEGTYDYDTKLIPFFAFDDVEKRAPNYYRHSIELIELTRMAMGITIDGLSITQPIGSKTPKKSLYDALKRLLLCMRTQMSYKVVDDTNQPVLSNSKIQIAEKDVEMLSSVLSPEFRWAAGTLFFEALQDIGDVINCIPRITSESMVKDVYYVTFDKVNDISGEYEL